MSVVRKLISTPTTAAPRTAAAPRSRLSCGQEPCAVKSRAAWPAPAAPRRLISAAPAAPLRWLPAPLGAALALLALLGVALPGVTMAQPQSQEPRGGVSALLEEVIVTARKREEGSQEVPLSVTAYASEQIEALKVRDLIDLSVGMPNVSLEDLGTSRGIANFSIRGLGINSSIPSVDPTVGVFINGVYLGVNNGIIFDVFDLESVEVLRGPQGTLFGRNVTGGAVLLNTKRPGDELEVTARSAIETSEDGGYNSYYMGAVGGPVPGVDGLGARLVLYYNDDQGPFKNLHTGDDHGAIEQAMLRGTVAWSLFDTTELSLMYEYNDVDGDGPAAQSHTNRVRNQEDGTIGIDGTPRNFDRNSFDFAIDETGYQEGETHLVVARVDQGIPFGDGTVTGILGYRSYESATRGDIDAQPEPLFHSPAWLDAEQTSLEVRYHGTPVHSTELTAGAFYFSNDIKYHERRELPPLAALGISVWDGGGYHDVTSYAVFAQADFALGEQWTLTAGLNFSAEEKDVQIAYLWQNRSTMPNCHLVNPTEATPVCAFDFDDDESWDNFAPKLGAAYQLDDDRQLYGHWTRGYRSGGYNLRNTDSNADPGPVDEEEVDNFEVGYKSAGAWGKLNVALFYMDISDQQRELNIASSSGGVTQIIRNTADTNILGLEVDGTVSLSDNLLLLASMGYLDAEYDKVREDLNLDGAVDGIDQGLDLPRAPELTYSLGLSLELEVGAWGYVDARVNWAYRDDFAYTDNNLGFVGQVDILDAGADFHSNDGRWTFSIYGRNLLDEVNFGGDTQLPTALGPSGMASFSPTPLGGTFSPLSVGRRLGLEVTFKL